MAANLKEKIIDIDCDNKMITSDQIRAARTLLKLSADALAKQSRLGVATIRRMELAKGVPSASAKNLQAVQTALEEAGIIFIGPDSAGEGVRFRHPPGQRNNE